MKRAFRSALLAIGLLSSACVREVTTSSQSYLSPAESSGVSNLPPQQLALEVTRLMAVRGFALVDQRQLPKSQELSLKFSKSSSTLFATDKYPVSEVGSVGYVWIRQQEQGSALRLLGKPTLDGAEPCSAGVADLPCSKVQVAAGFQTSQLSGRNEAILIHGVLSELALEGYLSPASEQPEPARPTREEEQQSQTHAACLARRHQAFVQAAHFGDPAQRAQILKSVPSCS